MCWLHLFSNIRLRCTWLVLSHIAEYHVKAKALTTTSLSCTDQMPRLFTLVFQTSYAQHHVAHSSKHPSHSGPCNKVIYCFQRCSGVEQSSVSPTAALMTLTTRSKPMLRTWASRPRPRPRTYHTVLEAPRGQGHGLEDSNTVNYLCQSAVSKSSIAICEVMR